MPRSASHSSPRAGDPRARGGSPASPWLLTPGPLTTHPEVRGAMDRDWGSRDPAFIALTARVREGLRAVARADSRHTTVPIQGSGTFVVEAALATLVGPADRLLVCVNGEYGRRMVSICERLGRPVETLVHPEHEPVDPAELARRLDAGPAITHVAVVHCETTTGLLNPLPELASVVRDRGRALLVDAMSSFGALELDLGRLGAQAVLASSNKCLEGVPGVAFAVAETEALAAARGRAPSLSLDLHAQWHGFESNGQWRFTPPTQVVAALERALERLALEGGPEARRARYEANARTLVEGMTGLGFRLYLPPALQAPIILTFHEPELAGFRFDAFYEGLRARGYAIYPGKLTRARTFRVGCIGAIGPAVLEGAVEAAAQVLEALGLPVPLPAS